MSTSEPASGDQVAAGMEVIGAGEAAAAAEPEPAKKRAAASRAIKRESASKGFELSDEQADKLAGAVVGKLEDLLSELPANVADFIRQAGGFDKLPDPIAPPAAPTGAGSLPEQPPAAPAPDEAPGAHASTGPKAFARWFRSA